MNKIEHISYMGGSQEWATEDKEYGVNIYPLKPNKYRSRCDEIHVWKDNGDHKVAKSCTLKQWLEKTRRGMRVRKLVCHDLGINIPIEIDRFLRNGE